MTMTPTTPAETHAAAANALLVASRCAPAHAGAARHERSAFEEALGRQQQRAPLRGSAADASVAGQAAGAAQRAGAVDAAASARAVQRVTVDVAPSPRRCSAMPATRFAAGAASLDPTPSAHRPGARPATVDAIDLALAIDLAPPRDLTPPLDLAPRLGLVPPLDLAPSLDLVLPLDLAPSTHRRSASPMPMSPASAAPREPSGARDVGDDEPAPRTRARRVLADEPTPPAQVPDIPPPPAAALRPPDPAPRTRAAEAPLATAARRATLAELAAAPAPAPQRWQLELTEPALPVRSVDIERCAAGPLVVVVGTTQTVPPHQADRLRRLLAGRGAEPALRSARPPQEEDSVR